MLPYLYLKYLKVGFSGGLKGCSLFIKCSSFWKCFVLYKDLSTTKMMHLQKICWESIFLAGLHWLVYTNQGTATEVGHTATDILNMDSRRAKPLYSDCVWPEPCILTIFRANVSWKLLNLWCTNTHSCSHSLASAPALGWAGPIDQAGNRRKEYIWVLRHWILFDCAYAICLKERIRTIKEFCEFSDLEKP